MKHIEIGNVCFKQACTFIVDGLENLESMKIGEKCFRNDYDERNVGVCQITNCPNLRQLDIGWMSFEYFKSFKLSNVNSLQNVKFGEYCFRRVRKLVINGLESLNSLRIGKNCFTIRDEERDDVVCLMAFQALRDGTREYQNCDSPFGFED